MITFILMLVFVLFLAAIAFTVGGLLLAIFVLLFGDLIVFILILKTIFKKR